MNTIYIYENRTPTTRYTTCNFCRINNYQAKNTIKFAKDIEKLVREITSESKLQKKILNTYWKEKFGELFDQKEIANSAQTKMF
jgi:ribosomal protein S18